MKTNIASITSIDLLRISVALVFMLHAIFRIYYGTVPQFAEFLNARGLPYTKNLVWLLTSYEIVGGILLLLGYFTKWLSSGFILILILGIVLIHASFGWFVGEHGTGGVEYSFILIISLLVIYNKPREKIET